MMTDFKVLFIMQLRPFLSDYYYKRLITKTLLHLEALTIIWNFFSSQKKLKLNYPTL